MLVGLLAAGCTLVQSGTGAPAHAQPAADLRGNGALSVAATESDAALAAWTSQSLRHESGAADAGAEQGEDLSDAELRRLLIEDWPAVGSLSLGRPNAGALLNGVQMPEGELWELIDPRRAWGTEETVDFLVRAIIKVNEQFPEKTHPMYIGHLSWPHGGPLRPHRSHQSGRDVDLSYYYLPDRNPGWYQKASHITLDKPRTWAFIRAMLTEADVEYIFINRSVQKLLKEHALAIGEDPDWLDTIFQYRSCHPEPIVRHAWGHATHMHVRFFNPRAQWMGARAYDVLVERKIVAPRYGRIRFRAREGDDLESLAFRFATTPERIRKLNGPHAAHIRAGRLYSLPTRGNVRRIALDRLDFPPRRLPPPAAGSGLGRRAVTASK